MNNDKINLKEESNHSDGCPERRVEPDTEVLYDLAELFKVFGDSTRIRIISALMDGEMCVYHLSEKLGMGQSAISHQLRILRSAGLVRPRRSGKEMYYSLDDEHIEEIYGAGLAHILHKRGHLCE
ncbi:MAG: metalloregulator ArsR/SmtB family transcription factor [Clostridia bacterium]|nr:metalloregulator ArsR/SmtB family transcription factor [Clostridia bacterium]